MALAPTATAISVREVLAKFDGEFATVAQAIENGEFAFWVGSGISRRSPSLGGLIERAMEYMRVRAIDADHADANLPALREALRLGEADPNALAHRFATPYTAWPEANAITGILWNKYSRVLDIRIAGTLADFILWDAIDIRDAFANPRPPSAEHLCIAILILEGVVSTIASANWDGFIEAAVDRLTGGLPEVVQVVVDPDHLRDPPGRARLLKFHGCIVHATADQDRYRPFLTGSHTEIAEWPDEPRFAAIRTLVIDAATNQKTLVLGLSIQDNNLQNVFVRAKMVNPWPWPCAPDAAAHVFCENEIKDGQRDVLRIVYGDAYNDNIADILEASHIRAWAEQVLIALVLRVVTDKLSKLMELALETRGRPHLSGPLVDSLRALRDSVADLAVVDPMDESRTPAVERGIASWSRMLAIFRTGSLPASSDTYQPVSPLRLALLAADPNSLATGLGELGVILALIQDSRETGHFVIGEPETADLSSGCTSVRATHAGAVARPLFFVKSAADAIALTEQGAFANDNAVVIHADDTWQRMIPAGGTGRRVRGAPGRTGRLENIHLSAADMLNSSNDADELRREFRARMIL